MVMSARGLRALVRWVPASVEDLPVLLDWSVYKADKIGKAFLEQLKPYAVALRAYISGRDPCA
jgi:hypothetical protein